MDVQLMSVCGENPPHLLNLSPDGGDVATLPTIKNRFYFTTEGRGGGLQSGG